MPSTDPICLVLEITPEACPARSGATDPMTAEVMGGITIPMPKPDTANGRIRVGQFASIFMARMVRKKPTAAISMPLNMSHLGPIRSERVPEVGEAMMNTAASGVITRPVLMAL